MVILKRRILWLVVFGLATAGVTVEGQVGKSMDRRHSAVHVLQSEVLRVEVMDPNAFNRYNRGVRFSPLASVLRVTMRGWDFLYSPVEHDPLTENCGLPSEFDIGTETVPPGFSEAPAGAGFIKIGVGILRKDVAPYAFYKTYQLIEPAKTLVWWGHDAALFKQTCAGVNGCAYSMEARIQVTANVIEITHRLINTGQKKFVTEQYAHNFFLFDGDVVGPHYTVRFPFRFEVKGMQGIQAKRGKEIAFLKPIPATVEALNLRVKPDPDYEGANSVSVSNREKGMEVRATVSRPSPHLSIHETTRYLCPEQFVRISLAPGQFATWSRRYEFDFVSSKE